MAGGSLHRMAAAAPGNGRACARCWGEGDKSELKFLPPSPPKADPQFRSFLKGKPRTKDLPLLSAELNVFSPPL